MIGNGTLGDGIVGYYLSLGANGKYEIGYANNARVDGDDTYGGVHKGFPRRAQVGGVNYLTSDSKIIGGSRAMFCPMNTAYPGWDTSI